MEVGWPVQTRRYGGGIRMRKLLVVALLACVTIQAEESLHAFRADNGKWGFCGGAESAWFSNCTLDKREIKIPAQFAWVGEFHDGMARVTREGRTNEHTFTALQE